MEEYKIRHRKYSPYHPQANGQFEVTNQELEHILTKIVALHKRDWAARLLEALWAYMTAWKSTTGFTPFELLYGTVAVMPIEFEHKTLRTTLELNIALHVVQKDRILHLNELDEWRKSALHNMEIIQSQRKQWHDKFIKDREFSVGD